MTKFTEFLSGYEENTLGAYAVSEYTKNLLFADPTKEAVKDGVNNLAKKMSNPYTKFRYWVKEEICDLNSILEAIYVKEHMENRCEKTRQKKKSAQANLDNLNKGKKNLTNFWKTSGQWANNITQYTTLIAQCE